MVHQVLCYITLTLVIYICIHIYAYVHIYIYIYIHVHTLWIWARGSAPCVLCGLVCQVSLYNTYGYSNIVQLEVCVIVSGRGYGDGHRSLSMGRGELPPGLYRLFY